MKKVITIFIISTLVGCTFSKQEEVKDSDDSSGVKKRDSVNKSARDSNEMANTQPILVEEPKETEIQDGNENYLQKAVIDKDSLITVYQNIRADYRIFGYKAPDTNARKLLLFSVFTKDVEGNPHQCLYGAYYYSGVMEDIKMKYIGQTDSFVEAILMKNNHILTPIFLEKKWVQFD